VTLQQQISNWILNYLKENNLKTLVIGISGGIDSAVTSTLCAMTGYPTKLLIMPIYQNEEETIRGLNHCDFLKKKYNNVEIIKTDLSAIYDNFVDITPIDYQNKLSLANTRARIRMTTLYMIAGGCKGIVVGTGNKVEDFGVGFFTKYGDGGVDISPIADLLKSEVYALAKDLCINNEIIKAPPTDGLWDDGRTDEEQLGVSYDELEWAMLIKEKDANILLSEKDKNILSKYIEHRSQNLHKMKPIPVFKKK
jgi:NAD+ synthase